MEIKFVKVRADKMLDGRIVYRGRKPKQRFPKNEVVAGAVVGAVILALLGMVLCSFNPTQARYTANDVEVTKEAEELASMVYKHRQKHKMVIMEEEDTIDESLVELLALVIYQEAGGDNCSDETRRMVGEVAMNRVADSRFPDTLEEVLLQKKQYGRLYWTGLVWPDRASKEEEAHAVQRAYDIARIVLSGEEKLLPDDVIFQAEFRQGTETVAESDGFYFCR